MGNRATVIFTHGNEIGCAVYLHWNGGPESIYAFLAEGERRKSMSHSLDYATARFVQIVGDFFDQDQHEATSVGIVNGPEAITVKALNEVETDHSDNGFYVYDIGTKAMRRFTNDYNRGTAGDRPLIEMSAAGVIAEREAAQAHKYDAALREAFIEMDSRMYAKAENAKV